MSKSCIVSIFGPDGSGKTTQIDLLHECLRRRKFKVRKTWISSHHMFAWLLQRMFVRFGYYLWRPSNKYPLAKYVPKEVINSHTLSKWVWMIMEMFGFLLSFIVKVELPRLMGYYVIAERGLASSLADLVYTFDSDFLKTSFAKLLTFLANNSHSFYVYLDANYEVLHQRRGVRVEPRDYIEVQTRVYRWFLRNFNCLVIDTAKLDVESTQLTIRNHLGLSNCSSQSPSGKRRTEY